MVDVLAWISFTVSILGGIALALAVVAACSAHVCRILAAALMAQADALEAFRRQRSVSWKNYNRQLQQEALHGDSH